MPNIDLSSFDFNAGSQVWSRRRKGEPEIGIAGTEDGPLAGRLAVAEIVTSDLPEVLARGAKYLDNFVDRNRFAPASEWYLDALEFGRTGEEPVAEFVASMSLEADVYGLWSVTFHLDERFGIFPVAFSRRQH